MACTFIAGKVEECYRRVRDIVNIFYWLHQDICGVKTPSILGYISNEYYRWRDQVTTVERLVLRALGFYVQPRHPTGLLVNYLNALEVVDPRLAQRAVNYVNDAGGSVVYICHQPNVVACAAIRLAAKDFQMELPKDPEWFRVFDVEEKELAKCCELICSVYTFKLDPTLSLTRLNDVQEKKSTDLDDAIGTATIRGHESNSYYEETHGHPRSRDSYSRTRSRSRNREHGDSRRRHHSRSRSRSKGRISRDYRDHFRHRDGYWEKRDHRYYNDARYK